MEDGGGVDSELELALALSISAAAEENLDQDDAGVVEDRPEVSTTNKMWLPQVSKADAGKKRRGKLKKGMITVLQTRTEAERQRLIGERVAKVLEDGLISSSP